MWRKEYYSLLYWLVQAFVTKFSVAIFLSWHICGKKVASSQLAASDMSVYKVLSWAKLFYQRNLGWFSTFSIAHSLLQ